MALAGPILNRRDLARRLKRVIAKLIVFGGVRHRPLFRSGNGAERQKREHGRPLDFGGNVNGSVQCHAVAGLQE
jgi:hypothetical protein